MTLVSSLSTWGVTDVQRIRRQGGVWRLLGLQPTLQGVVCTPRAAQWGHRGQGEARDTLPLPLVPTWAQGSTSQGSGNTSHLAKPRLLICRMSRMAHPSGF